MATQPIANDVAEPDVVGQIILLRPDQIDASGRLRPIDPVWAEALAGIMMAEGQRTPIEVCRLPGRTHYTLVTGGHRHAAATIAGMCLRAEVVTSDAAERRLREVSENLHRRDLAPIDRAAFIAELVALHKVRAGIDPAKDGRTVSVSARWQKDIKDEAVDTNDTMSFVYGWSQEVADHIGVNKRTIERDLLLHRRLSPAIAERLRGHPIARNATQLRALAKMPGVQQSAIADMIVAGAAKSVSEALKRLRGEEVATGDRHRKVSHAEMLRLRLGIMTKYELIDALTEVGVSLQNAEKVALYVKKLLKKSEAENGATMPERGGEHGDASI